MRKPKLYRIKAVRPNKEDKHLSGTLENFVKYFEYTFDLAESLDHKVKVNPHNMKAFVVSLNKAYRAIEINMPYQTKIELVEEEEA